MAFEVTGPDGKKYRVNTPDGATQDDAIEYVKNQFYAPKVEDVDATPGARPDQSWFEQKRNALASGPINLYLGAKQFAGGLSPTDQSVLAQNKEASKNAPVTAFAGNVLSTIPAAFIPGVNTVAGAGLVGGAMGALNPVEGDQSLSNIASHKLLNAGIGTLLGMGTQYGAQKATNYLQQRAATKTAEAAAEQSRNQVRDATLKAGQEAGYGIPKSEVKPSFLSNRLEGLAGKAAVKQEFTHNNQEVTNALARKAIGLAEDEPLSVAALTEVRNAAAQPYREIAALPVDPGKAARIGAIVGEDGKPLINEKAIEGFNPKNALEELKQARSDASLWFNAYNRTASPEQLAKAKEFRGIADSIENKFEEYATANGRPDLVPALQAARKEIAKTYTVERALNTSNGNVNAHVLARLAQKQKPLSDGLDTIGNFANAFPKFMGASEKTPAAGVGHLEWPTAAVMALLGHQVGGTPGMAAGAASIIPLMAPHAARSLVTSPLMQTAPSYAPGLLTQMGGKVTPEMLTTLQRAALPYGLLGE